MVKVPEIAAMFWIIKLLSTAMGEATSDYLVNRIDPVVAVGFGGICLVGALIIQFRATVLCALDLLVGGGDGCRHREPWPPMCCTSSSRCRTPSPRRSSPSSWPSCSSPGTGPRGHCSIHSIDSPRREVFYWATVMATFAMGTALGDLTATTLHLGYLVSAVLFAGLMLIPAAGYRLLGMNEIFAFWFAYVLTRPLGASIADWLSKPHGVGGLALGDGPVAFGFAVLIVICVGSLTVLDGQASRTGGK